jgi:hypothetical protein
MEDIYDKLIKDAGHEVQPEELKSISVSTDEDFEIPIPEDAEFETIENATAESVQTEIATQEDAQEEPSEEGGEQPSGSFKFGQEEIVEPETAEAAVEQPQITEDVVLSFLSDKLRTEFSSFDDVVALTQQPTVEDSEIAALLKFKQDTGLGLKEYTAYQSLDTSDMDDLTAIRTKFMFEYPELSAEEREVLISDQYRVDEDEYSESEVKIGRARLKADAIKAKRDIEKTREAYLAMPKKSQQESKQAEEKSGFDKEWFAEMEKSVSKMDSLEFELNQNESFVFKVKPETQKAIKDKNLAIDSYFETYVNKDGSWNHNKFNAHRAVLENLNDIVKTAYQQGMASGQKKVVEAASNVRAAAPSNGVAKESAALKILKEMTDYNSSDTKMRILYNR